MAAPVGDSYACPPGSYIAAGRYHWPSWRRSMAAGTWALVPGNKLSDVDPANNPAINPNYPSAAPWAATGGQVTIITAWCGACWDDASGTLWLPLQGGHSDYAGNEPYKNTLRADVPAWVMLRNPTGSIGNTGTLNDGQEMSGVYFDGRRRAIHSYNKPVYVPGRGPLIPVQGGTAYTAAGPNHTLLLNETSGEMTQVATHPNPGASTSGAGACYDAARDRVWWIGVGDGHLSYLDCTTWQWTVLTAGSNNGPWDYSSLEYVPTKDVLVQVLPGDIRVWTTSGIKYAPGVTGSGGTTISGSGSAHWCESLGCLLFWNNATNTTKITTLTPPSGDPLTQPWVLGTLAVSGSNSVTPTSGIGQGTYGRFQVSEKLGAAILLNAVDQQIYAFAVR